MTILPGNPVATIPVDTVSTMQAFICTRKPRSVQASKKQSYYQAIQDAYSQFNNTNIAQRSDQLYGAVYYFHKKGTQLDADNISKPIWDALQGTVYDDDSVIKLRRSGIIDLRRHDIYSFDMSKIPKNVFEQFIRVIDTEDHVLYIELGVLNNNMYTFGI